MRSAEAADGVPRPSPRVTFTVALPVYNEEAVLERLHAALTEACLKTGETYEILYVNDGSRDRTSDALQFLAARDPRVSVVELSRNFGHPAALAAAVDMACGDTLIVMDADLQDDPAVIPELLRLQREDAAEVVYVARTRRAEGAGMRVLFNTFHWLISRVSTYEVPRNAGSFGLLGPRALREMRALTERLRYFPGLRAFVGFKQVALHAPRQPRYDRISRVGLGGLLRLAAAAFFSQSSAPAALFYLLSLLSLLSSLGLIVYAVVSKLLGVSVVAWASTVTSVAFFSSVVILGQAFICEYLARIYEEVRQRPTYIVDRMTRGQLLTELGRDAPDRG